MPNHSRHDQISISAAMYNPILCHMLRLNSVCVNSFDRYLDFAFS